MKKVNLALLCCVAARVLCAQPPDTLLHRISNPTSNPQLEMNQGECVAVDGKWTVVGCPMDDEKRADSGSVKVYDTQSGALQFILPFPDDTTEPRFFGTAVAVSGNQVVVGAARKLHLGYPCGAAYVYDLGGASPTVPVMTLINPVPAQTSNFGQTLAFGGRYLAVGAPNHSGAGTVSGRVFIYDLQKANPSQHISVLSVASGGVTSSRFGHSIAIQGSRLAVGTERSDIVRMYDIETPVPNAPIIVFSDPSTLNIDGFGKAVALEGNSLVVGAPTAKNAGVNDGAVFVYDLGSATPTAVKLRINNPNSMLALSFGQSVGLSGSRLAVGAPAQSPSTQGSPMGRCYVYDLQSSTPSTPMHSLDDPQPQAYPTYGTSLAFDADRLVVGDSHDDARGLEAGAVYGYDLSGATPEVPDVAYDHASPDDNRTFGSTLEMVGGLLAVGMPGDDDQRNNMGSVHVFDLNAPLPHSPIYKLVPPWYYSRAFFSTAMASSGNKLAVTSSAYNGGFVSVYDLSAAFPSRDALTVNDPAGTLYGFFGSAVAMQGDMIAVSSPGRGGGVVYVYDNAQPWPWQKYPVFSISKPASEPGDNFGSSLALSGSILAVGADNDSSYAPRAGSVHVYDLSSSTRTTPILALGPDPLATQAKFGYSLALKDSLLFIGSTYLSSTPVTIPRVQIYDLSSTQPSAPLATILSPAGQPGDNFGLGLEVSGHLLAVRARRIPVGAANDERVYLYDISSPATPVLLSVLQHPAAQGNTLFGGSLATDGSRVVVGAPNEDDSLQNNGAVYVFGDDAVNTRPPMLHSPASNVTSRSPVQISFTLPEAALPGSVKLSIGPTILTLATSVESAGTHIVEVNPASPTSNPQIVDGAPISDGVYAVRISYQDAAGNAVAAAESKDVTIDTATMTPSLTFPIASTSYTRFVPVSFSLPESALTGSVRIYFGPHELALAAGHVTAGTHAFVFDSKAPSRSPHIATGAPIPDGSYTVTLSYQDTIGNDPATTSILNVAIDTTGPTGGTMSLSPSPSVSPSASVAVDFAGWLDSHAPLAYELLIDDVIVSALGSSTSRSFAAPSFVGVFFVKGRIYDALGNSTTVIATLDTGTTAQETFDLATAAAGLYGPDSQAAAVPRGDELSNLIKYAFNLDLSAVHRQTLLPATGIAGLPVVTVPSPGVMRIEYLRRAGSGLIYAPLKRSSLDFGLWEPITAPPVITLVDANWQRVYHDEIFDPEATPALFGSVEVTLP